MEQPKKEIKNLIEDISIMPTLAHMVVDLLRAELPFLKVFKSWDRIVAKPNKALLQSENSYDGVELTLWGFFDRRWNVNWKRVREIKKEQISFYTFHGCFETCPKSLKGYYLNLSQDRGFLPKAIKSHIDIASELGAGDNPVVIFHPGTAGRRINKARALDNLMNNLGAALNYADARGVTLTLENMPYLPGKKEQCTMIDHYDFQHVFKRLRHDKLKVTFDWGHINTQVKNKDFLQKHELSRADILNFKHVDEFIDELHKDIVHAHIHYNRSHWLEGNIKKDRWDIKRLLLYIFFWTDIVKFFREGANNPLDEHSSLNRIEKSYRQRYGETIRNLMNKSAIRDYGYITHEIPPHKILKYFTLTKNGLATAEEFLESLRIFKSFY